MGGGGFSVAPGDPALDRFVLDVAGVQRPRICLLATASGDPEAQIARFHRAYRDLECDPVHLSLFRLGANPVDLRRLLLGQHVIYVGGGSMLNLLAVWRAHGVDAILREAWERGIVLCGISAGSMCWFRSGVTSSFGLPRAVSGLGLLEASNSVHWRSEPGRRACFREAIRARTIEPGYGVDDGAGLMFAGTSLVEAVSARDGAGAWWVQESGGQAREWELMATRLSAPPPATPLSIAELRGARERRLRPNRLGGRAAGMRD